MTIRGRGHPRIGRLLALALLGLGPMFLASLAAAQDSGSGERAEAPEAQAPPSVAGQPEDARRLPSGRRRPTPEELAEHDRTNFLPIRDRWRIDYQGRWWDPYNLNVIKGDYPIFGQRTFFSFTGVSDTLFEFRSLPTPQGVSRDEPGSEGEFFGEDDQFFFNQNFIASFELFHGSTAFRPKDWAFRISPVFNLNYLDVQENGIVNIDVREGTTRTDGHVGIQELFLEKKLFDVSRHFDFVSARAGIQGFTSDFRGFIFADNQPGLRFFGNLDDNRYQWNVAYFYFLEKDTNSMLNTVFDSRHRQVVVVNLYKQDFIFRGYTAQLSFHHDRDDAGSEDDGGTKFDTNGFLVRPAFVADARPHDIRTYYLGWAGEGHIGRLNLSHAFYQVFGEDTRDPVAGRKVDIDAQMAAAELSYDIDWWRPKVSVFYASGDKKPRDGTARGFDSILDNVNFAGAGFSYFNRQAIPLAQTGVFINNRLSLLADLRSNKIQGQPAFVNPGVFVLNAGVEVEVMPKLRALVNFNYIWFVHTEPLDVALQQTRLRHAVGADWSLGVVYRPFLNNNVILTAGVAVLQPGGGLKDVSIKETLYSNFFAVTLTF